MSAHFTTPTDELLLLAETLGEVKTKADKLEAEFATQARPLEAATNALSAALSGIKALQFHVLDNNLGQLSARVEEMRKAVDEQVGVIALELKKADETNAAKAGQEAEALRSEIAALQAQLGTLGAQFAAQLERVEFSAKEEAKKLQLIPGPAGAAGASLNPRGTFIDGETYNRLDVVSWLGSSYIAAVDGVTEKPSKNSNQWQVLASRGSGGGGGVPDINAILPSQSGNNGKLLTTNGAAARWDNTITNLETTQYIAAYGKIEGYGGLSIEGGFDLLEGGMTIHNGSLYGYGGATFEAQVQGGGVRSTTSIAIADGIAAPSVVTGYAQLYVDAADGDLKIKFGDGTVKTIVTDT